MFIMLHHVGHQSFLGCIEVDDNTALSHEGGPDGLIERWYDEFQATQPDSDSQFVDYLTNQGAYAETDGVFRNQYAEANQWDGNPNDTPHHCYVGGE